MMWNSDEKKLDEYINIIFMKQSVIKPILKGIQRGRNEDVCGINRLCQLKKWKEYLLSISIYKTMNLFMKNSLSER